MKKLLLLSVGFLLTLSLINAQSTQELDLEPFEHIDAEGNIRLYLKQAESINTVVEASDSEDIEDYKIEVVGGTLFVMLREQSRGFKPTPKLTLRVEHPNLKSVDLDGLVYLYAENTLKGESLRVKGDGMIRGDLDVIVDRLKIDLDGMCKMTVVGRARESDLRVDGMGKIDARGLTSKRLHQSADGLASIKVGQ